MSTQGRQIRVYRKVDLQVSKTFERDVAQCLRDGIRQCANLSRQFRLGVDSGEETRFAAPQQFSFRWSSDLEAQAQGGVYPLSGGAQAQNRDSNDSLYIDLQIQYPEIQNLGTLQPE